MMTHEQYMALGPSERIALCRYAISREFFNQGERAVILAVCDTADEEIAKATNLDARMDEARALERLLVGATARCATLGMASTTWAAALRPHWEAAMSDLVRQLRERGHSNLDGYGIEGVAADEIERLRAELARLCDRGTLQALRDANDRAEQAERERDALRALLAECRAFIGGQPAYLGGLELHARLDALLGGRDASS